MSENQVDIGPLLENDDKKDFQNSFENNTDFSKNSNDTSSLEKEQLANNFEFDMQTKIKEKENEIGNTTLFFQKPKIEVNLLLKIMIWVKSKILRLCQSY